MMPNTVSALPTNGQVQTVSKIECTSNDFPFTLPLESGKGSEAAHAAIAIPTDSKTFRFDIDTNINIKTTTLRPRIGYLLPRLVACVVLILVVTFWPPSGSMSRKMQMLEDDMAKMYQEMAIITETYHAQKLLVEQIAQRFDESRNEHRCIKCLVERETQTTGGYDNLEDLSFEDSDSDSGEPLIKKSGIIEEKPMNYFADPAVSDLLVKKEEVMENDNISVNVLQEINMETTLKAYDVISETNTESSFAEAIFSASQRSARSKRSSGRGNSEPQKRKHSLRGPNIKNNKNKRRKANQILAVHFKGAFPETEIRDGGLIAPWFLDISATGPFGLSKFDLREGKSAVQVTEPGLYYIYAQVYYLTNETMNSFSINLRQNDTRVYPLAYCSINASFQVTKSFTEVSCFTSVIRYLQVADLISLHQQERNRRILMKEGQSFLGLVRLQHGKTS